jgi:hypothetical protein
MRPWVQTPVLSRNNKKQQHKILPLYLSSFTLFLCPPPSHWYPSPMGCLLALHFLKKTFLLTTSTIFFLFTFFIYCPLPNNTLPLVWPVLCSCPSLFRCLLVVQWNFCLGILSLDTLCLSQDNPLPLFFLALSPYLVLFNSFQVFPCCLNLIWMWCISLLLILQFHPSTFGQWHFVFMDE